MYRNLSSKEIALLEQERNIADDWSNVFVSDNTDLKLVRNNTFQGVVRLGVMQRDTIDNGNMQMAVGIYNSLISDSTIGDQCAIYNVSLLQGYHIGNQCLLMNISEMSARSDNELPWLEVMNENGGRRVIPFSGMRVGDAYLWARFRGHRTAVEKLEQMTRDEIALQGGYCWVGNGAIIRNTTEIRNVVINSSMEAPSKLFACVALGDGVIGPGCKLEYGIIAQRFMLGENVTLEFGLRLNDAVVGDNSTLARCEVGNSIIFPAHEQHHNNSFLIAGLIQGQSNIAAGGTIGSNHNGRTADNELAAGRGFWPGLCVSLKHSSRFASYCLLSKADYPYELNITLPFALVNNNSAKNQLEVMPAYWWMYNMYALHRNIKKFAKRDKRHYHFQHVEFDPFAPDTAEEMLVGRGLIRMWTEKAYNETQNGMPIKNLADSLNKMAKIEVEAYGMEHNKRKTILLKPGNGYRAYEEMLIYYAMRNLTERYGEEVPPVLLGEGKRTQRWINIGGQLVAGADIDQMLEDIETGRLENWNDIHERMDKLWEQYPEQKVKHAYQILCELSQKKTLDADEWRGYLRRFHQIEQYVEDQVKITRQKDADNEFRKMTYWDENEMSAVLE